MGSHSIRKLFSMVLLAVLVSACTTTPNAHRPKVSLEAGLQDHVQLGLNYISEGNRKSARHHILKALDLDDRYPPAHNAMALLFEIELEDELAEKHFKKAIAYDRDYSAAYNNYGVFLFKRGRYKDAYEQFEAAGGDTAYELRPQAFYSLGVTAEKLGKPKEAEDAWLKAIALSPRYSLPYLELAEHYYNRQDYAKARNFLERFDTLARPQARSLWLEVRLADLAGNRDRVASKGLALKKLFPNSRENQEYQEWLKR